MLCTHLAALALPRILARASDAPVDVGCSIVAVLPHQRVARWRTGRRVGRRAGRREGLDDA
eukprot:360354-Chlamydomonas_euryale.AAC.2